MKLKAVLVIGILLILTTVSLSVIRIYVHVSGKIDGNLAYKNFSTNVKKKPVKFEAFWENIGSIESDEKKLTLVLKPKVDLASVIIIPEEYPTAWIFPSLEISNLKKNKVKEVQLNYEATIWKEMPVTLYMVINDKELIKKKITLSKGKKDHLGEIMTIMTVIIVLLSITVAVLSYKFYKLKKKLKKLEKEIK